MSTCTTEKCYNDNGMPEGVERIIYFNYYLQNPEIPLSLEFFCEGKGTVTVMYNMCHILAEAVKSMYSTGRKPNMETSTYEDAENIIKELLEELHVTSSLLSFECFAEQIDNKWIWKLQIHIFFS